MRILQRILKWTKDTFLSISHTTNVLLFKFRCKIVICVRNIKEMPGSVASGTFCITLRAVLLINIRQNASHHTQHDLHSLLEALAKCCGLINLSSSSHTRQVAGTVSFYHTSYTLITYQHTVR